MIDFILKYWGQNIVVVIGEKRRVFVHCSYNYWRYAKRERNIAD